MPILSLTPKLYCFGFQNYNTHPAQNDVVLAIIIIIIILKKKDENRKKKERKKERKMKIRGGSNHPLVEDPILM
jgi:hypothetical protein